MGCFYFITSRGISDCMQTRILFIVNPKSGSSLGRVDVVALLHQQIDKSLFLYDIVVTEYAGHATELAQKAAADFYAVVCAVGGDGTVNEVARGLVFTDTALAILPHGSGNGLARHLGIPLQISPAIAVINQQYRSRIDSCTINSHPFFCTAGIGFDAQVSSAFASSLKRGLSTYVRLIWQEFLKYIPKPIVLNFNDQEINTNCFVLAFANASQYGNNAYIAPMADIRDGLLDICLIEHLNFRKALSISYGLLSKQIATSPDARFFQTTSIQVQSQDLFKFHADGEFMGEAKSFTVEIRPSSLQVIIPESKT